MEEDEDKRGGHTVRWANAAELSVRAGDVGALRALLRGQGEGGTASAQMDSQVDPNCLVVMLMERDPVHTACAAGHRAVVRFILTEVAPWSVSGHDRGGATALHTAARFGRTEIARDLLGHGALVSSRDRGACTPRK